MNNKKETKSPIVLSTTVDADIRETEIGETRGEWLAAMRETMGHGAFILAAVDNDTPVFALALGHGDDGGPTVSYIRVDQNDFGTTVRDPQEFGLPPAVEKLAVTRENELDKNVFAETASLRHVIGMVQDITRQPDRRGIDGVLAPGIKRELIGANETEHAGLVDGAAILLRFGAVSSAIQMELSAIMAGKLNLDEAMTRVFKDTVASVQVNAPERRALGPVLAGIHEYTPKESSNIDPQTLRAWMSAYASGVALRERQPDADGQVALMNARVCEQLKEEMRAQ